MKVACKKCNKLGVWIYMPGSPADVYCDDHVPRGCSCQQNEDGTIPLDEQGREYPCVEYEYDERGIYLKEV